jgi:hypothetical protein
VPLSSEYPRYRLIDLGTLGGANAGEIWSGGVYLTNRGELVTQMGTSTPDPYDPNCVNFDCFVWHAAKREGNGVITDLGALPGVNNSFPTWI